jgi:hypothetical protein
MIGNYPFVGALREVFTEAAGRTVIADLAKHGRTNLVIYLSSGIEYVPPRGSPSWGPSGR